VSRELPPRRRLSTPAGSVIVLRGDASAWDDDPGGLHAALQHINRETGHPVVFVDTATPDGLDLSVTRRGEAITALSAAIGPANDLRHPDADTDDGAADLLAELADAGWVLVRVEQ
jgi:hypothetical protein